MYKWKVCPIQGRQLKDVHKEDIIGDFRLCDTYRGGGGYDRFPYIAKKRGLKTDGNRGLQFVVQLYGCHLNCPYCYVTRDGVFGEYKEYTSKELVNEFNRVFEDYNVGVFHLMGGAPAVYCEYWYEILNKLESNVMFHSDLLLTEKEYDPSVFYMLNRSNALYAINIKGVTAEDYHKNTNRRIDTKLFWFNLYTIIESGINFYLTFTNPDKDKLDEFKEFMSKKDGDRISDDSFVIDLVDYEALKEEKI